MSMERGMGKVWTTALVGVTTLGGLLAGPATAQDFERVAPREIAPATPQVEVPEPPPVAVPQGDRVILPVLKGLVFVDGIEGVQPQGRSVAGVDTAAVAGLGEAFAAEVAGFIGQPLTLDALNEIARKAVLRYRENNRPLVDVVIPEQDINNGVVQLAVVEFRVGEVRIEGNTHFPDARYRDAVRLQPGDTVDSNRLLDDMEWINTNPFRQADLVYQKSAQPGRTDVVVRGQDGAPWRVYGGAEDTGVPSLGNMRYFGGVNWGDAFGLDHQFSYQLTSSDDLLWDRPDVAGRPDRPRYVAHSGSYTVPLPWRDQVTLFGAYSEAVPTLAGGFTQIGKSTQLGARYITALPRVERYRHELRGGIDFKASNNTLEFGGSVIGSKFEIVQGVIEYRGTLYDDLGSTAFNAGLTHSPGGLSSRNTNAAFQGGQAGAEAQYTYARAGFERLTNLPQGVQWSVRGEGQIASETLLPSEQFGIGGAASIRGYAERAADGDDGYLVVNELRSPAFSPGQMAGFGGLQDSLRFHAFLDHGAVRDRVDQGQASPSATLTSVGVGLRYSMAANVSLRYDHGWQLRDGPQDSPGNGRSHFSLLVGF